MRINFNSRLIDHICWLMAIGILATGTAAHLLKPSPPPDPNRSVFVNPALKQFRNLLPQSLAFVVHEECRKLNRDKSRSQGYPPWDGYVMIGGLAEVRNGEVRRYSCYSSWDKYGTMGP